MDPNSATDLVRAALLSAIVIAAPMLVVGMAAGLLIGLLQALTQIQDQTVAFVPKILAMAGVLLVCTPWLIARLVEFTQGVIAGAAVP